MINMSTDSARLSVKQRQQFEDNGYYCPVKVLSDAEVKNYLSKYMEYAEQNRARLQALPAKEKYQVLAETHFVLPWVHEIITNKRILDAVETLLGPNILTWNTTWFTKMPGDKTYISWHQDGTYWNLTPPTVITAWVALSPSSPENGCLRVVPGTHKQPAMPQRETYAPDNALSRGQEIAVDVNENDAVDLALKPGEMSLHHIWIVHGSKANTSTTPRIGIAIRYTKPEVYQDSPVRPMAMLVRGKDTIGNFELLPPPTATTASNCIEAHAKIVARIRAGVMATAQRK